MLSNNTQADTQADNTVVDSRIATRRKLLTSLIAGSGAFVLAACGGGGDNSVADSVADRWRKRNTGSGASPATPASSASSASATTTASAPAAASSTNAASTSTAGTIAASSFGVKADGKTNDRAALQAAIDGSVGQILVISGQVRMDTTGLKLRTNSHIRFASGASIKLLPHNADIYQMMLIEDVSNVIVENAYLDGSKELNSASGGEHGMGFSIIGGQNVHLIAPTTINTWGDGIYINDSQTKKNTPTYNLLVDNHKADGCRRQGVSIISGDTITFNSPVWQNINGTAPACGLDFEPNDNSAVFKSITINSPTTANCKGGGINVWFGSLPGPISKTVTIAINNHVDTTSQGGSFAVQGLSLNGYIVNGQISSTNPKWKYPLIVEQWDNNGPRINVQNPTIVKS
ncbi:Pectate lyase superfamily protein [Caballeronia temeraria]|uniref:Pectate lyase superfamily protein n=1 Tax=Caballeronia temeraria TaxID=1777137 RepID=A0A158B9N5_9BURK|nr:hypothetical protein [Caballeronia temeraria]SAK66630.1 Pectate lyase superfamily protein [Caballeronia temeraria]